MLQCIPFSRKKKCKPFASEWCIKKIYLCRCVAEVWIHTDFPDLIFGLTLPSLNTVLWLHFQRLEGREIYQNKMFTQNAAYWGAHICLMLKKAYMFPSLSFKSHKHYSYRHCDRYPSTAHKTAEIWDRIASKVSRDMTSVLNTTSN